MNTKLITQGGLAALVAMAFTLGACKKAPDSNGDSKKPAGDNKPAPSTSGGGSGSKAPVTPPPAPSGGGSVEKQIEGYWAPDKESLLAMAKKDMEAEAGAEGIDAQMLALATAMIEQMADQFVIHLEGGKSKAISPDGPEEGTYKITSSDAATGKFTAEMIEGDSDPEIGEGTVSGDVMTMTREGMTMKLNRISKAEADKRMSAPAPTPPGLPPGIEIPDINIPDIEIPDVPTPDIEIPDVPTPDIEIPDVPIPDAPSP